MVESNRKAWALKCVITTDKHIRKGPNVRIYQTRKKSVMTYAGKIRQLIVKSTETKFLPHTIGYSPCIKNERNTFVKITIDNKLDIRKVPGSITLSIYTLSTIIAALFKWAIAGHPCAKKRLDLGIIASYTQPELLVWVVTTWI